MQMMTDNKTMLARVPTALRKAGDALGEQGTPMIRAKLRGVTEMLADMIERQDTEDNLDLAQEIAAETASDTKARALRDLARELLGGIYTLVLSEPLRNDEGALLLWKLENFAGEAKEIVAG